MKKTKPKAKTTHLTAQQRAVLEKEAEKWRKKVAEEPDPRWKLALKDIEAELKGLPTFGRPRFGEWVKRPRM